MQCRLLNLFLYIIVLPCPNDEIRIGLKVLHGVDRGVNEAPGRIAQIVAPFTILAGLLGARGLRVTDLVWVRGGIVGLVIVRICNVPKTA